MATISATYLGDLRVECTHNQSGTKIITDAPVDNHGKGEAFSPTDLRKINRLYGCDSRSSQQVNTNSRPVVMSNRPLPPIYTTQRTLTNNRVRIFG